MTTHKIVGNNKGGVAKDLVAEGFEIAFSRANIEHELIEIESQPRLKLLYPHARFIKAAAIDADTVYRKPDVVFEPMDTLSEYLRKKTPTVSVFGANLTDSFLSWSSTNGQRCFGAGETLHFICVLTMNKSALTAGLDNLYDFGVQYPSSRRTAILNEFVADFVDGDRHLAKRLTEAQGDAGVIDTLKLTRMAAPNWGYIQNLGPLADVAKMPPQKLIDLGLPEGPAVRSMAMFERWLENDLIAPLSLLLPTAKS